MDAFFKEYLEPFVDTSTRRWKLEKEIGVRPETLAVFQKAKRIRQTFFEPDNSLRVEFGMKPVYLDQHITRFVLELGGQDLVYKHGPARAKSLSFGQQGKTKLESSLLHQNQNARLHIPTKVSGVFSNYLINR